MGDVLLLPDEVNPVMSRLLDAGFRVTALHNHFTGETPRIMDLHYEGEGSAGPLATKLSDALLLTSTPRYQSATELIDLDLPAPDAMKTYRLVEKILGQEGILVHRVLEIAFPRAEPVRAGRKEIPSGMGVTNSLSFQWLGSDLAAAGNLVVADAELTPVLKILRLGNIRVEAIHDRWGNTTPPLKFIHFWGRGSAEGIASALRSALDQIPIRR